MKTIFIYGPPASGKLTIAQEVEKQTNYFLFHNHLIVDFVKKLVTFDTDEFWDVCLDLRKRFVSAFAKEKKGLIMTLVYNSEDNPLITHVQEKSEEVYFVQLMCDEKTLHDRVGNDSRKQFQKISDSKVLGSYLDKFPAHEKVISAKNHIEINTDELSATQAAEKIISYFQIQRM